MPPKTSESSPEVVAKRLRLTRQVLGLSQTEFAARAGLQKSTYNQYERAKQKPSVESAIAIAAAHKLTLDWIFLGDPSGLRYETMAAIKVITDARIKAN